MRINKQGSINLAAVLIVAVLAIGGIGYYVYSQNNETQSDSTVAGNSEVEQKSNETKKACRQRYQEAEAVNKQVFCDSAHGATFLYEDGWTVEEERYGQDNENVTYIVKSPGAGTVASEEEIENATYPDNCRLMAYTDGAIFRFSVNEATLPEGMRFEEAVTSGEYALAREVEETTMGGQSAFRYIGSPGECYNYIATEVKEGEEIYSLRYRNDAEDSPNYRKYIQEYEELVDSFNFGVDAN